MTGKDIHDAVEFIGPDLVEQAETQKFFRPVWKTILSAAAVITLLLGAGITMPQASQLLESITQTDIFTVSKPAPEIENNAENSIHPLNAIFPLLEELPPSLDAETEWGSYYLNEAGIDDAGTEFHTIHGDQILAIDAKNEILLIRIRGEDYQGVLAVVNDPTKLSLQASSQIGTMGETAGTIAAAHDGVLAINASRYLDLDGSPNGGSLADFTMCDGISYNEDLLVHDGQARLEIDSNGIFTIISPADSLSKDVRHAVQTTPSLITDGMITPELDLWSGKHPRSCIGQTIDGAVLMLVIEGCLPGYSLGTDLADCAQILARYGAVQAMNLDYGTSSILWYDGEYVTKCSNPMLPEGRNLPNAFVIQRAE